MDNLLLQDTDAAVAELLAVARRSGSIAAQIATQAAKVIQALVHQQDALQRENAELKERLAVAREAVQQAFLARNSIKDNEVFDKSLVITMPLIAVIDAADPTQPWRKDNG